MPKNNKKQGEKTSKNVTDPEITEPTPAAGQEAADEPGRKETTPVTQANPVETVPGDNPEKAAKTPKVTDSLTKIGRAILKTNPAMPVVYMTADGRGFYEKNDADNHAKTLTNRAVTPVKR